MDYLWSPWRYQYVTTAGEATGCIFCDIAEQHRDAENYVIHRARLNYVILNRFPYTSCHLMIVPYAHQPALENLPEDAVAEMILLARQAEKHLRANYHPDGLNMGINIGKAAGAGVAGHLHMHVLPRWIADANFMTTVGETRVLPEDLRETFERLTRAWAQ
jgi:ATP adenylyltransferase